jgi:hypothetical protein
MPTSVPDAALPDEASGMTRRWTQAHTHDGEPVHILALRSFRDGARVHVKAERRMTRRTAAGTDRWWAPFELIVDAETGLAAPDDRVPWVPLDEEIARARAHKAVDQASLRAVSRDGALLFFVLGRNWTERPDPDAGTVVSCDATLGLWDARAGAWRWETAATPDEMGCGSWLFEQGGFEMTFDESGIFGRVELRRTAKVYDVATGALRQARTGDFLPAPSRRDGDAPVRIVAADAARTRAVGLRGSVVEVWDLADGRVVDTVDLGPGDEPSAATILEPASAIVVGTAGGQLLRLDVPSFAASPLARWQALGERTRTKLTRAFTDAVLAKLKADPWYSSFSAPPRVEVLGASERDGVTRVHFIADHLNYCYAQSGSDWADHALFAGDVTLQSGAPPVVNIDQVKNVNVTERQWDDGYDREPAVSSLRAHELARLAAASTS